MQIKSSEHFVVKNTGARFVYRPVHLEARLSRLMTLAHFFVEISAQPSSYYHIRLRQMLNFSSNCIQIQAPQPRNNFKN